MKKPPGRQKATIIIPLYNSASTLDALFASLARQKNKELIAEIIAIDDNPQTGSYKVVEKYRNCGFRIRIIRHARNAGLANGYNEGISLCKSEFFILMHADVVISGTDAFSKALAPFKKDKRVVAAYPVTIQPFEVWDKFSFWQKCFFRKYAGVDAEGLLGKFDCFKRDLFVRTVGRFDSDTHRTAGEDNDMSIRIREAGLLEARSGVRVIHLHSQDGSFTLAKLIHKESQYAEAAGALLRRHGISWLSDKRYLLKVLGRPLLIIGLFVPYVQYAALLLLLAYSVLVTKKMFQTERNDRRIFILPLVNIAILFYYTYYLLRGFVTGKQRL